MLRNAVLLSQNIVRVASRNVSAAHVLRVNVGPTSPSIRTELQPPRAVSAAYFTVRQISKLAAIEVCDLFSIFPRF